MMLSNDYKDMLLALSEEDVKFLLIGAYAMASHGYPRTTMDIDFWVMPSPENAEAVLRALTRYGAPLQGLTAADFQEPGIIFQIGVAPQRVDILTSASGLNFDETLRRSAECTIDGVCVRVPCIDDLIQNKKATGRPKDLVDVTALEALQKNQL